MTTFQCFTFKFQLLPLLSKCRLFRLNARFQLQRRFFKIFNTFNATRQTVLIQSYNISLFYFLQCFQLFHKAFTESSQALCKRCQYWIYTGNSCRLQFRQNSTHPAIPVVNTIINDFKCVIIFFLEPVQLLLFFIYLIIQRFPRLRLFIIVALQHQCFPLILTFLYFFVFSVDSFCYSVYFAGQLYLYIFSSKYFCSLQINFSLIQ